MKIKPMLGSFALDNIEHIESSESRALVEHRVPGLAGSYFQDMGTVPNTILIIGTKYGDEARDDFLKSIREIFNKGEPTTFVADINTATDITDVLIEDLDVAEVGGSPDTFRYKIKIRKYIKPPEPTSTGLLDAGILEDATKVANTAMNVIDTLGSSPDFGNPNGPLSEAIDGVKAATTGIDAISNDLKSLLTQQTGTPPIGGATGSSAAGGATEAVPAEGSKETPSAGGATDKTPAESAKETMPEDELPIGPLDIPPEAWDALESLRQKLKVSTVDTYDFGVGIKRTAGKYVNVNKLALIVYVPEKKPSEEVPSSQQIPAEFKGFPTDVVENYKILLLDSEPYDPLRGGIEISTSAINVGVSSNVRPGTLGVVVRRRSDGRRLFLTCEHVASHWINEKVNTHDCLSPAQNIFQPSDGEKKGSVIGQCVGASRELDAAIIDPAIIDPATSSPTRAISNFIQEIGPVRGSNTVKPWDRVWKRGRTTGLTDGVVMRLKGIPLREIEIDGFPFDNKFCDHGDSGSAVLNNHQEVVALLNGMSDENCTTCFATLIDPIREALGIDIAVDPVISSITPNYWDSSLGPVVIEGSGFESPNQVDFGGVPAQLLQETPTRLDIIPPSMVDVAVVNVRVCNKWQDFSEPGPQSLFEYQTAKGIIPTATPRELTYTTVDVIDKRISVPAQHSLVRLSKNPDTSSDAVGMLEEVKADRLAAIYCVNWEKSAKRAIKLGTTWWDVIPDGEDAVLMLDPDDLEVGPPMISFRRGLDPDCGDEKASASPSRIDAALIRAWQGYLGFRNGKIRPGPCPNSALSIEGEPVQSQPKNVAPPCCGMQPVTCQPVSCSGNLDAAVDELKTKVNNCKIVQSGTGYLHPDCRQSVEQMRGLLRSRHAFTGCMRAQKKLPATDIHQSIQKDDSPARCCIVQYKSNLGIIIDKLKESLDDGFLVKTGVLAGVCTTTGKKCSNPHCCEDLNPEHWILIIGHDGGNKFVFWDPTGHLSNATSYCQGFGFLFYDASIPRFSTAENDTEMDVDSSGFHTSARRAPFIRLRCCPNDPVTNLHIPDCCHEPGSPQARYQVLQLIAY